VKSPITLPAVRALALAQGAYLVPAVSGGWLIKRSGSVCHTDDLAQASDMLRNARKKPVERFYPAPGASVSNLPNKAPCPVLVAFAKNLTRKG
jgi:hypothetical protein